MREFLLTLLGAAIAAAPFGLAQPQAGSYPASFEAATIKPAAVSAGEGGNRMRIQYTPNSLTMSNVALSDCVQWAYSAAPFQISAAHVSADSYDIRAKAESPVPVRQLRVMLQDLLTKRFQLTLHRETRMLPVYELVVAKGGSRLPAAGTTQSRPAMHATESLPRVEGDSFVFADASIAEFARMFGQLRGIELPVVDRTGIEGTYDIILKSAPAAAREADTGQLLAIVQEQLGLKLSSARAPFEVIVLDHAEKPSEN